MELSLKLRQLFSDVSRIHAIVDADSYLKVFEPRLAAKRTNPAHVRHREIVHEDGVPVLCRGDGWRVAPLGRENNLIENLTEILA